MKKIYLDCAATAPVDPLVKKAMEPYFSEKFGNPGSLHSFGQEALKAVDESREKIAEAVGAPPSAKFGGGGFREIIFTGSATEANNLALRGVIKAIRQFPAGTSRPKTVEPPLRIITSAIEHESILETCRDLEKEGIEIIYLPVDKEGIVDLKKLEESLNKRTVLVSIIYANNEIGTVQPIVEIANIISNFRNSKFEAQNSKHRELPTAYPLIHTDAVQAFQFLDCDVNKSGVDLLTLSAHKIYGPKGIGALCDRNPRPITHNLRPIITGGRQEFGLRSGTENVPSIAGFAKAVELAVKNREKETKRISALADYFWREIKKICPAAELNGTARKENKIPNILNIHFPGCRGEDLLVKLDLAGVAVSSGSACSARALKPSHVLKAIGRSDKEIKSSLRFSFSKFTTKKEIKAAIEILKKIL